MLEVGMRFMKGMYAGSGVMYSLQRFGVGFLFVLWPYREFGFRAQGGGGGGLRAVQGFGFSAGDCPAHLRHSMVFRGRPVTRWLVTAVSVY